MTDLSTLTFEELIEELERITRQMAAGEIGIEEVADLYEQAGRCHAEATRRLEGVRARIERLGDAAAGAS
jgi:exodeoxyribonuclease VII small subunit